MSSSIGDNQTIDSDMPYINQRTTLLFSKLPSELLSKIILYLDADDFRKLALTCRHIRQWIISNISNIRFTFKYEHIIEDVSLLTHGNDIFQSTHIHNSIDSFCLQSLIDFFSKEFISMRISLLHFSSYSNVIFYYHGDIIKIGTKYYPYGNFKYFIINTSDFRYRTLIGSASLNDSLNIILSHNRMVEDGLLSNDNLYIPVLKELFINPTIVKYSPILVQDAQTLRKIISLGNITFSSSINRIEYIVSKSIFADLSSTGLNMETSSHRQLSNVSLVKNILKHNNFYDNSKLQPHDSFRKKILMIKCDTIMYEVTICYDKEIFNFTYKSFSDKNSNFSVCIKFRLYGNFQNYSLFFNKFYTDYGLSEIKTFIQQTLTTSNLYLIIDDTDYPTISYKDHNKHKKVYGLYPNSYNPFIDSCTSSKFSQYTLTTQKIYLNDIILEGNYFLEELHTNTYKARFFVNYILYYLHIETYFDDGGNTVCMIIYPKSQFILINSSILEKNYSDIISYLNAYIPDSLHVKNRKQGEQIWLYHINCPKILSNLTHKPETVNCCILSNNSITELLLISQGYVLHKLIFNDNSDTISSEFHEPLTQHYVNYIPCSFWTYNCDSLEYLKN